MGLLQKAEMLKDVAKKSRTWGKMRVRKYQKAYKVYKQLTVDLPKMRQAYKAAYALWNKTKAARLFCERRVSESRLALHRALYRSKRDLETIGDHLGANPGSSSSAKVVGQLVSLAKLMSADVSPATGSNGGAFKGV